MKKHLTVREHYQKALTERGFLPDAAQNLAIDRLQLAYDDWIKFRSYRANKLKRWIQPPTVPRGVYLWGGVGRGKSFLMDSFYSALPIVRKVRVHFHEFMRDIHTQLDGLTGMADPLDEVARRIAKKYRLICFDEFHVSDVADAMMLYNLLKALFKRGVSFVMTSNYPPEGLYPDGLHRDRIMPAIALLKEHMDVMHIDSGVDYRRRVLEQTQSYYTPLDSHAEEALRTIFEQLAGTLDESPLLNIEGRTIRTVRRSASVVWFDFATLCEGPRSQNDYLDIARYFRTVMVSGVPKMSADQASSARRFTWLIDVLYDSKIKLILSAAVPPEQLYVKGTGAHEFHRTVSRMIEMQSQAYVGSTIVLE